MSERTFRFTDAKLKSLPLPPEGKQWDYFDTDLTGFGCRASYGGTKSFFVMYGTKRQRGGGANT